MISTCHSGNALEGELLSQEHLGNTVQLSVVTLMDLVFAPARGIRGVMTFLRKEQPCTHQPLYCQSGGFAPASLFHLS